MDQIKNFAEKKLDQNAQPGNDVERKADSGVNDSKSSAQSRLAITTLQETNANQRSTTWPTLRVCPSRTTR